MEPVSSWKRIKSIADSDKRKKTEDALSPMVFSERDMQKMIDTFEDQIRLANSTDENLRKQTDLFWENTFVRRLLDGTENGTYIGLDLGGTNFRIVRVDMTNGEAKTETKYYNLEPKLRTGPCAEIFDYIAICLKKFLNDDGFNGQRRIPLGFTFSFPSVQKSLKHSTITTWTKSITCPDGPGLDSVTLLEQAIERQGGLPVDIDVVARISDTTGTLLAGDLVDKQCRIGLIVATGSNAAYVEYIKNIEKWDACYKDNDPSDIVLINCEFGCFGDNGCLDFMKNEFVREVDQHSNHPGSFTFEKHFSGMYLGELCRLTLVKLINAGILFKGEATEKLFTRWAMTTSHVTLIEKDTDEDTSNTVGFLNEFDVVAPSEEDVGIVREVCAMTSMRGAYVVGTAMVVLLNHINLPEVTIAVDGSLFEHHPTFRLHMETLIAKWRRETKTTLTLVKDGSGQGGALVAAINEKTIASC